MMRLINSLLALSLLALGACSRQRETGKAPPPVQVTAVTQATIRRIVNGDGALFPRDQASIVPKIAAPVQRFYVNRGDHVRKGQLLAVLENGDLRDAADESKGTLEQAESNLRTTQGATVPEAVSKAQTDLEAASDARASAKRALENRQKLFQEGALAGRLVDDAQVAYSQANSQF